MGSLKLRPIFIGILLVVVSSWANDEKAPEVKIRAFVDSALITIGEQVKWTVELTRPKAMSDVSVPEVGGKISGFRVVDFGQETAFPEEDTAVMKRWYLLEADVSGSYVLPSVTLTYPDAQNNEVEIATSEIFVEVKEDLASSDEGKEGEAPKDIKEIKGPISLGPHPLWKWSLIFVGTFLLMIGGIFLWRRKKTSPHPMDLTPFDELALEKILGLKEVKLKVLDDYKKTYFSLSEILRNYFESLTNVPASDRTTEEMAALLPQIKHSSLQSEGASFLELLRELDTVKFTDYLPSGVEVEKIFQQSTDFVEKTRPKLLDSSSSDRNDYEESVI